MKIRNESHDNFVHCNCSIESTIFCIILYIVFRWLFEWDFHDDMATIQAKIKPMRYKKLKSDWKWDQAKKKEKI